MEIVTILTSINTLISTFRDIAILIILILGIKYLGKEINKGIKQIPVWIEEYSKIKFKQQRIDYARVIRN